MRFLREPDENSGPALADREPIVLPEQRKKVADRIKEAVGSGSSSSRENPEEYNV